MKNKLFLLMLQHGGTRTDISFLVRSEETTSEEAAKSFDHMESVKVLDIMELKPADVVEEESFAEFDELFSRLNKNDMVNLQWAMSLLMNRAAVYGTLRFETALSKKA